MRTINVDKVTEAIKEMCISANYFLSSDMETKMKEAREKEESPLGKQILSQLLENLEIAGTDQIPICQDTGMAVVFLEVGQDVHFEGGSLEAVSYTHLDVYKRQVQIQEEIYEYRKYWGKSGIRSRPDPDSGGT